MIDYLIVGAGTTGAVLAARLADNPDREVLLLEAGPDYPTARALPKPLRDGYAASGLGHDWTGT